LRQGGEPPWRLDVHPSSELKAMALMVLGFLGFVVVTVFWLCWAVLWVVAAICIALFWLVWPLTLLILAAVAWRAQSRHRPRHHRPRAEQEETTYQQSGNSAFDEYRAETLSRLDEERNKFSEFLERLRKAKDRQAFDNFMSERRGRPAGGAQGLIGQQ
jgi:hypothetical protein